MFVNAAPVPVTAGENTIYVRAKMDLGTKTACMDALQAVGQAEGGKAAVNLHFGAYQLALLQHNIVSWQGPAFSGQPCTAATIARLDPDEPLVERALAEIVARNPLKQETAAGEKKELSAGGRRSKASTSSPEPGTPT